MPFAPSSGVTLLSTLPFTSRPSSPRLRGGGLLDALLRRSGGLGERLGLVEYFLRLGRGERDTDFETLRALRLGGGERDSESETLRARRLGGGERERLDE